MDILDFLGCEHKVMQAGMADISRAKLASAVSTAGGIGTIGLSPPPQFEADILDAKQEIGDRPYAVNLLMPYVTQTHVDICLRNSVPIVTLFFGISKKIIDALRTSGSKVLIQVGDHSEARIAVEHNVDGLIVQGREAGGHVRGKQSLAHTLPGIREAFPDLPIFASGGVYDHASAKHALGLGADAVSCGTRFLMTHESFAHEEYKQRLLAAKSTVLTKLFGISWPDQHRVIPNGATERWSPDGHIPAWLRAIHQSSRFLAKSNVDRRKLVNRQSLEIPIYTPSPLKPGMSGASADVTALYAGECVASITEQLSAADVVQHLAA